MDKILKRNYWVFKFLHRLPLAMTFPTYILFLAQNKLSLLEIGLLNFSYMLGVMFFEIPTGVVADIYGRRKSMLVGIVIETLGLLAYFLAGGFWQFFAAELILAFGASFLSGAQDAWIKDSLDNIGSTECFGGILTVGDISQAVGCLLGGILGAVIGLVDYSYAWLGASVVMLAIFWPAKLLLKEDYFKKSDLSAWQNLKNIASGSWRYGVKNPVILLLIGISFSFMFFTQGLNMQWTLVLKDTIGVEFLPHLWFGLQTCMLLGLIAAKIALKRKIKEKQLLFFFMLFLSAVVIVMSRMENAWPLFGLFLLHETSRGAFYPLHKTLVQKEIPSAERATISSFVEMTGSLAAAAGWILSGLLADATSFMFCWLICGLGFLIPTLLTKKLK
jgi:MFS transporter, DHA3 family, tetracycline resistance protein